MTTQQPPAAAFYEPLGDGRFRATAATAGPWDPAAQHGGPPAALLGHTVEGCSPRPGMLVARMTLEILGPVPVGDVVTRARVSRPGRRVELVEAEMEAGGRLAVRAQAWRIAHAPEQLPTDGAHGAVPPRPDPETGPPNLDGWHDGYLSAIEWRFARGAFAERGPATVWARARVPLLAGEEPSPLARTLLVADSGNGLSNVLDIRQWWFINPELTVHLYRQPVGEWICLEASTAVAAGGVGLAESRLYDDTGPVGRGAQALYVAPRG